MVLLNIFHSWLHVHSSFSFSNRVYSTCNTMVDWLFDLSSGKERLSVLFPFLSLGESFLESFILLREILSDLFLLSWLVGGEVCHYLGKFLFFFSLSVVKSYFHFSFLSLNFSLFSFLFWGSWSCLLWWKPFKNLWFWDKILQFILIILVFLIVILAIVKFHGLWIKTY